MCMAIAGVLGAAASVAQGVMGMQQAKYNAALARQEATRIRTMGALEEGAIRRRNDLTLGQQAVDIAASGRALGAGSSLDLAFYSRLEGERDALYARAGYQMRSEAKDSEARLYKMQGAAGLFGSALSAGGQLLGAVRPIPALG
jgi:hypothetical protein